MLALLASALALPSPAQRQKPLVPDAVALVSSQCPTGCTAVAVSVHGDPMVRVNGTGTHFWAKEGVLMPLLSWTAHDHDNRALYELSGKSFSYEKSGNQWFNQFVVQILNLYCHLSWTQLLKIQRK